MARRDRGEAVARSQNRSAGCGRPRAATAARRQCATTVRREMLRRRATRRTTSRTRAPAQTMPERRRRRRTDAGDRGRRHRHRPFSAASRADTIPSSRISGAIHDSCNSWKPCASGGSGSNRELLVLPAERQKDPRLDLRGSLLVIRYSLFVVRKVDHEQRITNNGREKRTAFAVRFAFRAFVRRTGIDPSGQWRFLLAAKRACASVIKSWVSFRRQTRSHDVELTPDFRAGDMVE